MKITGVRSLLRKLRRFDRTTQKRIVRASLRTSTNPVKKEMRKQIRAFKAVEKKNLVKSIVTKLKTYASGVIFLIVGARAKRLDDGAIPANYIHLVGGRVRRHRKRKNPGKPWRVKTHRRGWITLPDKTHPGSGRKPFREQAAKNTRKLVAIEFRKRAADLIKKELTKNG